MFMQRKDKSRIELEMYLKLMFKKNAINISLLTAYSHRQGKRVRQNTLGHQLA